MGLPINLPDMGNPGGMMKYVEWIFQLDEWTVISYIIIGMSAIVVFWAVINALKERSEGA